ncbi:MAG TPA: VWA domain-containing protein [Terriglobales bacterium]|nr:VWA domain-containing protein [Terriglobales bacterium]
MGLHIVLRSALLFLGITLVFFKLAPDSFAQSTDEVPIDPPERPLASNFPNASGTGSFPARLRPLQIDVNLVLVPVTVTDAANRPVMDLELQNFSVYEQEQPQKIRYFSTEDAPISVGLIVDVSKSMSNKIDAVREAVGEFFRIANPEDDYFVITFADRPRVLADTTQSVGTIREKLASITPAGHTALLDAIYLAEAKMRSATYSRRALLIISDGGDNHSRYRAKEIRQLVQEADVEIYAIGIFDSTFKTPEEWAGKRLLTDITGATGGRCVTLDHLRELPQITADISWELRSQYVLGYRPETVSRDNQWHTIKVRVAAPEGVPLQVHAKKGYLATAR